MIFLDLDSSQQPLDYGKITAVIRYRTPYLINNCDHLLISFAFGNDVLLRCVIGMPTLLCLGDLIDLVKGTFFCSELNCTFILTLNPPGMGLPESVLIDNSTPTIPQGTPTNIR